MLLPKTFATYDWFSICTEGHSAFQHRNLRSEKSSLSRPGVPISQLYRTNGIDEPNLASANGAGKNVHCKAMLFRIAQIWQFFSFQKHVWAWANIRFRLVVGLTILPSNFQNLERLRAAAQCFGKVQAGWIWLAGCSRLRCQKYEALREGHLYLCSPKLGPSVDSFWLHER